MRNAISRWDGGRVEIDGRLCVMLGSNNYLGLAQHPKVVQASHDAYREYGVGMAMNPTLATTPLHVALERAIADFCGMEAALLFNSCTAANCALIPTLFGDGDTVFSDRLNHASIIDACRLSRARTVVYPHADTAALETMTTEAANAGAKSIISDGVFSMEGDTAPLDRLAPIARALGALMVLDESHAIGTTGRTGRGTSERFGLPVDAVTGTFSKALGGVTGGFVAGERRLIDALYERARFFIFTSPMSPASAAAALAAIEVLDRDPSLVDRLRRNATRLRTGLRALGFRILGVDHAIIPVMVGDTERAVDLSKGLLEQGIFAPAMSFPVVPQGEARLRVQASALHSDDDLDHGLDSFDLVGRRLKLI
jgi:glycine C-acetyltransferase